jgi:hypothetical protein
MQTVPESQRAEERTIRRVTLTMLAAVLISAVLMIPALLLSGRLCETSGTDLEEATAETHRCVGRAAVGRGAETA